MTKIKEFIKKHPKLAAGVGTMLVAGAAYWGGPAGAELAQVILSAIFGG